MNFLYLIGAPGSGKSTLMRAMTKGHRWNATVHPIKYMIWEDRHGKPVIELGGRRKNFSGTDVMPLNAQPRAIAFVEAQPGPLLMAEGDRLANDSFFGAVEAAGYKLRVVYLDPPGDVLEGWRNGRAAELGKAQDESWVKGRITKARALADDWRADRITTVDLHDRLDTLRGLNDPVVDAMIGGDA